MKTKKTHIHVGFTTEKSLQQKLRKLARSKGVSLSVIMRWAAEQYLAANHQPEVEEVEL
jgi:hypothetical protein